MKRRTGMWLAVLAIGTSLGGMTGVAQAAAKDATGTWKWSFMRPGSDTKIEITLKLVQEGEKLTGTFAASEGGETKIKDGFVKDGGVNFKVDRQRDGDTFTIHYMGKIEGDTIKGKSETEISGEKRTRDWEAKREP
jgi:hypothetical protein